jgi:hypothetical protein
MNKLNGRKVRRGNLFSLSPDRKQIAINLIKKCGFSSFSWKMRTLLRIWDGIILVRTWHVGFRSESIIKSIKSKLNFHHTMNVHIFGCFTTCPLLNVAKWTVAMRIYSSKEIYELWMFYPSR